MKYPFLKLLIVFALACFLAGESTKADWQTNDIGTVGVAGDSSASAGVYTIRGAGGGIDGIADAFTFMSQTRDGDFEITARVTSVSNDSPYAAAGLMLRQDLAAGSANVFLSVTGENVVNFSSRTTSGGITFTAPGPTATMPVWLRLQKAGTLLSAYMSNDGANWTMVGWDYLTLIGVYRAGLGVSSSLSETLTTGVVDNIRAVGNFPINVPGLKMWLRADAGVTKSGANALNSWADQSGNGNDASQSVAAAQPTWSIGRVNGLPSIVFNGTSNYLSVIDSPGLRPNQVSTFVVTKTASNAGALQTYFVKSNNPNWNNGYGMFQNGVNVYGFINNYTSPRAFGSFPLGSFGILSFLYDAQNIRTGIGNSFSLTPSTVAINHELTSLTIGGRSTSSGNFLNGEIAEVLLFGRALSNLECQQVQAYLNEKYNLAAAPVAPAPSLSGGTSPSGIYTTSRTVNLDIPTDSVMRYTLDGSDPTESSLIYTGPFTVSTTTIAKFRNFRPGFAPSAVLTLAYTFDTTAQFTRDGLALWLRADQGVVANAGLVSQWNDLSGNNNNVTQLDNAKRPTLVSGSINGQPALCALPATEAGTTEKWLSVPHNAGISPTQMTMVVVGKQSPVTNWGAFVSKPSGSWYAGGYNMSFYNGSGGFWVSAYNSGNARGDITADVFKAFTGSYDGQKVRLYVDNVELSSTAFTTGIVQNTNPLYVLGSAGAAFQKTTIAEILLFNRVLTESERKEIQKYLYLRYQVGSLPITDTPSIASGAAKPGIYPGGPLSVAINVPDQSLVYYTDDGSEPTASSILYTDPVTVNNPTTLKFKAFRGGYDPSPTFVATYTFDPLTQFARNGLALWLRADQGVVSNGGTVSQWNDISGNENHGVQQVASQRPSVVDSVLNGQAVMRFNGAANTFLSIAHSASIDPSEITMISVAKQNVAATNALILRKLTNPSLNKYALYFANATTPSTIVGGATSFGSLSMGTYGVLEMTYDQTQLRMWVNGNLVSTTAYSTAMSGGMDPLTVGGAGPNLGVTGDVAEILMFSRAINAAERKEIELYLYERYAVGARPIVDAPVISSSASAPSVYTGGTQNVSIDVPSGSIVYYTTDGSEPTTGSTQYVGPISVSSTTTFKFKAFREGYMPSATFTASYAFDTTAQFTRDGLALWLRADQGVVADAGLVSQWSDLSGNNNNVTQSDNAKRPTLVSGSINGQPALCALPATEAGTTEKWLSVPHNAGISPTQMTMVVVGKQSPVTNWGAFVSKPSGPWYAGGYNMSFYNGNGGFWVSAYNSGNARGDITADVFKAFTGSYDGQKVRLYVDNVELSSTGFTTGIVQNTNPLYVLGSAGAAFQKTTIAEVLFFNRILNESERKEVQKYLFDRYSLGALPLTDTPSISSGGAAPGVYTDGSQNVVVNVPANSTVYYTTDESEPTTGSTQYVGPISVSSTTVFKFKAFREGYMPSATFTASYAFDTTAQFTRDGLALWLRADQGVVANAGLVSQWNDLSGNNNNVTQSDNAKRPTLVSGSINGQPALCALPATEAGTTEKWLSVPHNAGISPTQMTMVVVGKQSPVTNWGAFVSKPSGPWYAGGYNMSFYNGNGGFWVSAYNSGNARGDITADVFKAFTGSYDGQKVRLYVDNVELSSTAFTTGIVQNTNPLYVLGSAGAAFQKTTIAEVLLFNRVLTESERKEIQKYIYDRYSLGSLPLTDTPSISSGGDAPGVYTGGSQSVVVNVPANSTVYYTTDGSEPTVESTQYVGPISVSSTTVFKFKAFREGYMPSATFTASYAFDTTAQFTRDGLVLWLRADQGVVAGAGLVSQWNDLSGNNNNVTQSDNSKRPTLVSESINGQPAISSLSATEGATTEKWLSVPHNAGISPTQMTMVVVGKQSVVTNWGAFVSKPSGAWYAGGYNMSFFNGYGGFWVSNYNAGNARGNITADVFKAFTGSYDGQKVRLYVDNVELSSTAFTTGIVQNTNPLYVLGSAGAATQKTTIAEVLFFNRILNESERKEVQKYLFDRYSLGALPLTDTPSISSGSVVPAVYSGAQTVFIDVPEQSQVYYTTNGSEPTINSISYNGSITVGTTTTIKAIAVRPGFQPSAVMSATYTVDPSTSYVAREGLKIWLRADSNAGGNGTTIDAWADQSGNANSFKQATVANQPTLQTGVLNGKAIVRFDGVNDNMAVPFPTAMSASKFSVVFLLKPSTVTNNNQKIKALGGWGQFNFCTTSTGALYVGTNESSRMDPTVLPNGTMVANAWQMYEYTFENGATKLYKNGTLLASATLAVPVNWTGFMLGDLGADTINGDLAEVLVYSGALTEGQRKDLEVYLNQRYNLGLGVGLPSPQINAQPIFSGTQEVSLTSFPGTSIYYTVDGTDPTTSSSLYLAPFSVSETMTVKALAVKQGSEQSAISSSTLILDDTTTFTRSGLKLWLRADAGLSKSGQNVSQWLDLSGTGNTAAQSATTSQPLLVESAVAGKSALRFDGADDFLSIADAASLKPERLTVYVVGNQTGGGDSGTVFFKSDSTTFNNGYGLVREGIPNIFGFFANNNATTKSGGAIPANNYFIAQGTYDLTRTSFIVNGRGFTKVPYTTALAHSVQPLRLGGNGTQWSSFGGEIAEVLFFDRVLTPAEQADVEKYLEVRYGINTDFDGDGLSRGKELELGTDPENSDSNHNGMTDGSEYASGRDPAKMDSDDDGLSNAQEIALGTNPFAADSDGDGISDADEIAAGTNPSLADTDGDGMPDGWEVAHGLNPEANDGTIDSDGDGYTNIFEHQVGLDPSYKDTKVQIASGYEHSLLLKADGTVWAWGSNVSGRLGDGTIIDRDIPVQVNGLSGVVAIAAGYDFSIAAKSDGTVWTWGYNGSSQLGDGTTINRLSPVQVAGLSGVIAVGAADSYSMVLKNDGSLWGWGYNGYGQLGDGTTTNRLTPVQVSGLNQVVAVGVGSRHSMAVKSDGTVWGWGHNTQGQLGDGTTTNRRSPVQVNGLSDVIAVGAGHTYSVVIKNDGTVWAWGYNGEGRLGDGTTISRTAPVQVSGLNTVTKIDVGRDSSMAIKNDGTVWGWGSNAYGKLGEGSTINQLSPVQVDGLFGAVAIGCGGKHTVGVKFDGTIWASGSNGLGQLGNLRATNSNIPRQVSAMNEAVLVDAGANHAMAILEDGTVWGVGANGSGQLGDGTTIRRAVPTQVSNLSEVVSAVAGDSYSIALKRDGTVWSWGYNGAGRLGDGTTITRLTPVQVNNLSEVVSVAAGSSHSIAIKSDGTVWAWGGNGSGRLGDGTEIDRNIPVQVSNLNGVVAVASGDSHSIAVKSDGTVWAWGSNGTGQLGDGTTLARSIPVQVANLSGVIDVKAGNDSSMALKTDGTVWAWGSNYLGKLGDGTTMHRSAPVQVVNLSGVIAIEGGAHYSMALKSDGTVRAWGNNGAGQLGDGTTTNRTSPVQVSGLYGVAKLGAGAASGIVLKYDGSVSAWGSNSEGQLGMGYWARRSFADRVFNLNAFHSIASLSVLAPASNSSIPLADSAEVRIDLTLGFRSIAKVEYYNEGIKIGESTQAPWSWDWTPNTWGEFHVGAIAIDSEGNRSLSSNTVTVTVPYDSDNDGLGDWWEIKHFGNLHHTATTDFDQDGLTDVQELELGTDPNLSDTDGDGVPDSWEVTYGLDPKVNNGSSDADGDGVLDIFDIRPGDPSKGELSITITLPTNGSIIP